MLHQFITKPDGQSWYKFMCTIFWIWDDFISFYSYQYLVFWCFTFQSTFFQSDRDNVLSSWAEQVLRKWIKCIAQGHNTVDPPGSDTQTSDPLIPSLRLYLLSHCPQPNILCPGSYEPWHGISNDVACATSKASDHPAHTCSLIRAFASRLSILWLLSYWLNIIWSF